VDSESVWFHPLGLGFSISERARVLRVLAFLDCPKLDGRTFFAILQFLCQDCGAFDDFPLFLTPVLQHPLLPKILVVPFLVTVHPSHVFFFGYSLFGDHIVS